MGRPDVYLFLRSHSSCIFVGMDCTMPQRANKWQGIPGFTHPPTSGGDSNLIQGYGSGVFFSLQSLCIMHTGKPTGVAVSHCITWFQTANPHYVSDPLRQSFVGSS